MLPIASCEAIAGLLGQVQEVEDGQLFITTNRGRTVAVLRPMPGDDATDLAQAILAM